MMTNRSVSITTTALLLVLSSCCTSLQGGVQSFAFAPSATKLGTIPRRPHASVAPPPSSSYSYSNLFASTTAASASEAEVATTSATTNDINNNNDDDDEQNEIMWQPSQEYMEETLLYKFQHDVLDISGDYEELWKYSIDNSDDFWPQLLDYLDVQYEGSTTPTKVGTTMPYVEYFPNVRLNFAQNLLRYGKDDSPLVDKDALISVSEAHPGDDSSWTFGQLRRDALRIGKALRALGVTENDAVGAYLPNIGETVIAMLGTTSTGATWSSVSPDFGPQAVVDRFTQIQPSVLFVANGYVSKATSHSMIEKIEQLVESLLASSSWALKKIVVVDDMIDDAPEFQNEKIRELVVSWNDFLEQGSDESDDEDNENDDDLFTMVPFSHPQFVLYSSGTTGMPKSIAHGAGNVLLQHAKELMLHGDLRPGDRMLFFTTCGWMMWNWMVSSLYAGATVVLFDGFAAYPKLASPWELVAREKVTHMGTTPRYLQACRARVRPGKDHDLSNLRVMFSTGSPLAPEDFDYVYEHIKKDVLLASISGGTDICSCFALGNPLLPVRKSELQAVGLGQDVCAYDTDERQAVAKRKGELVCRSPFVAAPVCFYGDDDKKTKYRNAYFKDEDPGVWYHGDLVEITGSVGDAGGMVIHGRSDTTLKPGGVRIGTAEVYRFAEEVPVVEDSLVIGDQYKSGKRAGDVRIVLFVKLADGMELNADIEEEIRQTIRSGASDAHVPSLIKQVQGIPYTKSGKKVEIAVRDLFAGEEPKNMGALQDASVFDEYRAMAERGLWTK